MSLRAAVDMVTTPPPYKVGITGAALTAAHVGKSTVASASTARAKALRAAIAEIIGAKAGKPPKKKRG